MKLRNPERDHKIAALYQTGISVNDLSERFNLKRRTIYNILEKLDIPRCYGAAPRVKKERNHLIITLRETGLTIREIAEEVKLSPQRVAMICKRGY